MRRKLIYSALIGSGLLVAFVAIIVTFPGLWFRPAVLSRVAPPVLKRLGYDLGADSWEASAKRQGEGRMRFALKLGGASFRSHEPGVAVRASVLELAVDIHWPALSLRLAAVPRLVARVEEARFGGGPDTPQTDAPSEWRLPIPSDYAFLPGFLREVTIGEVDVVAPALEIGRLALDASVKREGADLLVLAREWRQKLGEGKLRVPLSSTGAFAGSAGGGELVAKITGQGDLRFAWKPTADCPAETTCIRGDGRWDPAKPATPNITAGFDLSASERRWDLKLDGSVRDLTPLFGSVDLRVPCTISATQEPGGKDVDLALGCAVRAGFRWGVVHRRAMAAKLPAHGDVQIQASARLSGFGQPEASYAGKLSVDARPPLWPQVESSFQLRGDFQGELARGLSGLRQQSTAGLSIHVRDAREFAASLADTPWAVPAPLNNLDGSLDLELSSRWKDLEAEAPIELKTSLASKEQSLRTSATGRAKLSLEPTLALHIEADWSLDDVRLSMPRLDLREMPRLFPSSSIRRAQAPGASSSSAVHYELHLFTPAANPLRVDVNLLPEPVALDVDVRLSDRAAPTITASARPLGFEIFRRQGTVESFRYTSSPARPHGDVDGRVRLKSGEYLVFARVYGRADRVRVQLTSEPAVGNDELWAILLFGEPMRELDADQQDSSQATARALSQGAFGLASLYVFARTPIERVSYDPLNQQVAVQFRLQEGTSLQVGHSEEATAEVGVRKRLGKGWSVDAKVTPGESEGDRDAQVGVGLEWSTRY